MKVIWQIGKRVDLASDWLSCMSFLLCARRTELDESKDSSYAILHSSSYFVWFFFRVDLATKMAFLASNFLKLFDFFH